MKGIKHTCALFILFLGTVWMAKSQTVVLCDTYDTNGKATGIYSSWDIDPGGGNVYIVYNQYSLIDNGTWYLYIDYDWHNDGEFGAYESIQLTPDVSKTWLAYDYKFTEGGNYKVMIMHNGVEAASTDVKINVTGTPATSTTSASDVIDTYYYEDSEIVFCSSVDDVGNPVGVSGTFSLGSAGSVTVVVYLDGKGKPFKTTHIFADIYEGDEDDPYDSFGFDVQADWDYVKFNNVFTKPGEYTIDLYNNDDIYINTGTVTITQ